MKPLQRLQLFFSKYKISSVLVIAALLVTSLSLFDFSQIEVARARPELKQELRYMKKKHAEEKKSLKAQHRDEMKATRESEKAARRQFFAENKEGEKRRAYVQEYVARMKSLEQKHKEQLIELRERQKQELMGNVQASGP